MSVMLQVEGVSKRFGGLLAVSNVSFTIREREILGLIGPNGAGKTTLFNIVNGVYKPDTGKINFDGHDITGAAPNHVVKLGLARTHQIVKPLNAMSVLDNVTVGACFGRESQGLHAARETAHEVLKRVGMGDREASPARSLTLAGKKRLEVARALAAKPKLLLLDEVLAGLTPTEVAQMIDLVLAVKESGVSVFMIEHVMQAIMKLSDRIVVLNFGQKLAEGTPREVAADTQVIEAYLGDEAIADKLMEKDNGDPA